MSVFTNSDSHPPESTDIDDGLTTSPEASSQSIERPAAPSKKFQDEAFQYVSQWCKASRDYVSRKVERWKLLQDLYHNRRDLNSWSARAGFRASANRARGATGSDARDRWQADIILSPSYIVDNWADRAYQAIFNGPEWLTVISDDPGSAADASLQYPTPFKLQELLLSRLAEGQIHVRLYEILQHLVLYGSVYAKIFWYSKTVTRHGWDYETLEVMENEEAVFDCPVVQVIPLDRMLVDWTATHADVQRHTGVGHRVDKTFEHISEQFGRGVYNLNREEFLSRWGDSPLSRGDERNQLLHDPDSDDLADDEIRRLTVWEWHGRVPTDSGPRECLCAIVTDRGADSPADGLIVRLTDGPVLWSGLRPFLAAHYTPLPGPFGMGAVENNLDLIHSISQFLSQSQDNARLTANAQLMVRRGSSAARQISAESDAVFPGKVWTVDDPGDIQPFPPLNFPQQDVNYLIDFLNGLMERRSSISDVALGVAGRAKSATEAHILQEASSGPFTTRTDLFARTFLEPLGRIALSMLQQFILEDQTLMVRDPNGTDVPLVVTSEELSRGRRKVVATLTRQDSTRIAKAQSIERVLPTLAKFQPVLAQEGVQISFSEILKRYLDLIGVDGVDRVLTRIDPLKTGSGLESHGAEAMEPAIARDALSGPPGQAKSDLPAALVKNGGPMGDLPTDANALAQLLQMQAAAGLEQH